MGQVKKSIEFRRRIGQQAKTLRTGQFHLDDGKQLSEWKTFWGLKVVESPNEFSRIEDMYPPGQQKPISWGDSLGGTEGTEDRGGCCLQYGYQLLTAPMPLCCGCCHPLKVSTRLVGWHFTQFLTLEPILPPAARYEENDKCQPCDENWHHWFILSPARGIWVTSTFHRKNKFTLVRESRKILKKKSGRKKRQSSAPRFLLNHEQTNAPCTSMERAAQLGEGDGYPLDSKNNNNDNDSNIDTKK